MNEKVVIVGAGPAGLTAALYAARADLRPLCIEGPQAGGQLTITTEVENFPGFTGANTGPELVERIHKQAERFGARFLADNVDSVDLSRRPFAIRCGAQTIAAEVLIVASGASARWLGIDSERALTGHGVSACATCDGFFFRGKDVLVVGGGDTAMEEALFLTRFCKSVRVVHRRGELRASKIMRDRAMRNEKISFIWNAVIEDIHDPAAGRVTGARLRDTQTGATSELACDGIFMAVGHTPNTAFLGTQLQTDPAGFIVCRGRTTETSVPGVFAAGDVADPRYKQAISAAGTGCMAAIDAERFLEAQA